METLHVGVATVRSRTGDSRTGEQHDGAGPGQEAAEQADLGRGDRAPMAGVGLAGAVVQDDGAADEHRRQQEVAHDERWRQLEQHGEAAEHDLGDDAGHQRPRPPDQVAAAGTRNMAPSTARMTATETRPVISRFPNSM